MRLAPLLFLLALTASPAAAQPTTPYGVAPDSAAFGRGAGVSLVLTNSGFGLGGVLRVPLSAFASFALEMSVGSAKDEREQEFFVGYFGNSVVPFKRSYAMLAPIQAGTEVRLFRREIEDDFRPFLQVFAGPALAYQWPYFDDANADGVRQAGEDTFGLLEGFGQGQFRAGVGATLALGAYFGRSTRATTGLRFGYQALVFPAALDLLETREDVEDPSQRFFGTPIVSLYVLRLW